MASVQVIMLLIKLGQGIYIFIFNMKEQRKLIGTPFKCPDNLLDVGLMWSAFLVIVAVFVNSVLVLLIYLLIN